MLPPTPLNASGSLRCWRFSQGVALDKTVEKVNLFVFPRGPREPPRGSQEAPRRRREAARRPPRAGFSWPRVHHVVAVLDRPAALGLAGGDVRAGALKIPPRRHRSLSCNVASVAIRLRFSSPLPRPLSHFCRLIIPTATFRANAVQHRELGQIAWCQNCARRGVQ